MIPETPLSDLYQRERWIAILINAGEFEKAEELRKEIEKPRNEAERKAA